MQTISCGLDDKRIGIRASRREDASIPDYPYKAMYPSLPGVEGAQS